MTGAEIFAQLPTSQIIALIILVIWEIIWTGTAMWKAARRGNVVLFVIFLVVNIFAIPEIIYIFGVKDKKQAKTNLKTRQKLKSKKR